MKYINIKYKFIGAILLLISLQACKKFTEEYNPGNRTAETYYNTVAGYEDLAKSNYAGLRTIVNYPGLLNIGTDIFSSAGINDQNGLNLYNSQFNSANGDVDSFYKQVYSSINIANNTLYWANEVEGGNAATIATRVAEAKALRAYYYFLLAETFGDVPLVTTRTTSVSLVYTRIPEKDIYTQIIQDLNEAIAALPATTTDFGRVTKGFAQHLLAKVYLTRGYKSYGAGNADFTQAATLAETVINSGNYVLQSVFSTMFDPSVANFQANKEVIFSVQYSTNATSNNWFYLVNPTDVRSGNNLHQLFTWDTQNTPIVGRSVFYGKTLNAVSPDPYFFSLFNKTADSRYLATVFDAVIAENPGAFGGKTYAKGDTLLYYPAVAFTAAQKAAKKYIVLNPDEYRNSPFLAGARNFPQFKKFRDPFVTTYAENGGARDTYVFRLAETYLIASEANLKLGNLAKAVQQYNVIRTRAAKTGTNPASGNSYASEMQVTTISIDNILEERARELAGEEFRWFELKRTGKLIERTLAYNDEAKAANQLKAFHLLRPIPQSQIDLNRGSFPQNPGY